MNKQKQDQKKVESYYMEEARQASSIFPHGELVPHEEPDFLLRTDRGTIGIEVTELCREEPRAAGGKLAKVPNTAQKLYNQLANAEPVDVSVGFSAQAGNVKFNKLTNSLVEFVHRNKNNKGSGFTRDLPEGYCHIGIFTPLEPLGRWRGARGFDTVVAPKELLESRIAEKNKRVPDYRVSTPEVWLLIVNDQFLGPGEVYAHPDHLAEWKFVFDFEKVLLFSRVPGGGGEVIELLQT
jgi:hypothetical protein